MESFISLDENRLKKIFKKKWIQLFRLKQIYYDIFKNQNIDFDEMTTLSKDLRKLLKEDFFIVNLKLKYKQETYDTVKFWFETNDWKVIETVLMYHWSKYVKWKLNRMTICLSVQVWCPVWCKFCVTWKMWFTRNLTYLEMLSQILYVNSFIKKKYWKKEDWTLNKVRNIVFMWMWEPLLNYEEIKKLLPFLLEQKYLSLSKRHITISTSWIISWIQRLIDDDIFVKLAVSLHSPEQILRQDLIPIAEINNLKDLMQVLDKYVEKTNNRIFYEYIMIKWKTDTVELAQKLISLLKNRLSHINLIPYNSNPIIKDLFPSDDNTIYKFKSILEKWWLTVTIRESLWSDLDSACWQLWTKLMKK